LEVASREGLKKKRKKKRKERKMSSQASWWKKSEGPGSAVALAPVRIGVVERNAVRSRVTILTM
jgi:hypothetical protein